MYKLLAELQRAKCASGASILKEARKGFLQLMYMSEQLNIKTLWF